MEKILKKVIRWNINIRRIASKKVITFLRILLKVIEGQSQKRVKGSVQDLKNLKKVKERKKLLKEEEDLEKDILKDRDHHDLVPGQLLFLLIVFLFNLEKSRFIQSIWEGKRYSFICSWIFCSKSLLCFSSKIYLSRRK